MVLWVFGYGSLVWNPGFDFDEKVLGYIKGYRRVFDLACIDHRGTPEHPARTCTLEVKEGEVCWGIAYCVNGGPEKERAAMLFLEERECEYDKKASVEFYKDGDSLQPHVTDVLVFISTPDVISNRYYLGPAPLEEMARQIATATGPCGNNRDYLFSLEKALFEIGHEDDSVIELGNEVRKVLEVLSDNKTVGAHFAVDPMLLPPVIAVPRLQEGAVINSDPDSLDLGESDNKTAGAHFAVNPMLLPPVIVVPPLQEDAVINSDPDSLHLGESDNKTAGAHFAVNPMLLPPVITVQPHQEDAAMNLDPDSLHLGESDNKTTGAHFAVNPMLLPPVIAVSPLQEDAVMNSDPDSLHLGEMNSIHFMVWMRSHLV